MNCHDFELIAADLAQGPELDIEACAHAESCPACAARLAAERRVMEVMKALALADQDAGPGPESEILLRSIFRRRANEARTRRFLVGWSLAAAAGLLVLLVGPKVVSDWSRPQPRSAPPAATRPEAVHPAELTPPPASPAQLPRRDPRSWNYRELQAANRTVHEVATQFIPLPYGETMPPIERGAVVRVKLPSSALAAFGLPVIQDRVEDRVQADVLVGEDGMARAIRLVAYKH